MDNDAWGKDPSVQIMRSVFKEMETAQHDFLERLGIPSNDLRMRKWRERALALFERAWSVASSVGIAMDGKKAAAVYVHCLARLIGSEGNEIPGGMLPQGSGLDEILKAVLP